MMRRPDVPAPQLPLYGGAIQLQILRYAGHECPTKERTMRPHTAVNRLAEGTGHHRGLLGRRRQLQGTLDDQRHATIAITFDVYGHLIPGGDDEARDHVDGYLDRLDGRQRLTVVGG
jgi:hypothetical protein